MKNANWFNAMVQFHNTVRFIQRNWDVPKAIAREMQHAAAVHESEAVCNEIAAASTALRLQVGA